MSQTKAGSHAKQMGSHQRDGLTPAVFRGICKGVIIRIHLKTYKATQMEGVLTR